MSAFSSVDVPISLLCGSDLNMIDCVFVFINCLVCRLSSPYCGNSGFSSLTGSVIMFLFLPPGFMNLGPSVVRWLLLFALNFVKLCWTISLTKLSSR